MMNPGRQPPRTMRRLKTLSKSMAAAMAAFLCLAGTAHSGSEQLLRIHGEKTLVPTERSSVPVRKSGFKSDVSIRNLLQLERETPFSLPRFSKLTPAQSKTLKILAIRVEFQEEIPDDPRTTGNGLFDMRTQDEFLQQEGHLIDPSPHDTLFFDKHIQALHNYWWTVSNGQLALEGEVFPKAETLAYRLPYPMVHYGAPDSSLGVKVEMLRQFFHDSFNLADSLSVYEDPLVYGIDFAKYDCFVIFHAGSDLQSDLGSLVNPTPGDLFTGYIRLGDTVWVNGGTFPITDGMFMPETKSQDNRVSALNGVMAHEFGHQLGLVDIYNSQNFMTQVGDFALMDNNAQNVGVDVGYGVYVSGVLPVYPCAWSRAYLGFVEPQEITGANIELRAVERLAGGVQLVKVPISPQEYFLVENRKEDADDDRFSGLRADSATNVILGPVDADRNYNREYDWLLPGSGILIFHVDESVAYLDYDDDGLNNFWDNQLQAIPDRRFLTLVEADGIVDFGGNYYTGFGQQEDMFYRGNNTEFTPHTFPSSKSANKSDTHVRITDISRADTVMTLNVARDWDQAGFPRKFIPESSASSMVADLSSNRVYLSSGRFIHAWGGSGSSLFPHADSVEIMQFDSTLVTLPLAIFAEEDENFVGPPSLGDLDGDDTSEVVAATVSGRVYAWHPYDRDSDGRADVVDGFPVDLNDGISVSPIVADFDSGSSTLEIFVATKAPSPRTVIISHDGTIVHSSLSEGSVIALATTGNYRTNFLLRNSSPSQEICTWNMYDDASSACMPWSGESRLMVAGDIDRDGDVDAIFYSCTGSCCLNALDLKLGGSSLAVSLDFDPTSGPVLGDIDQDGYLEIILTSSDKVYAYNFNGALMSDFPVTLSLPGGTTDLIESSPIIGDADGDGYPDIIVGTKDGRIVACNKNGRMVDGFPLPVGGQVSSSPVMVNLDKDSDAELLVAADDGFVYAWDLPGEYDEENVPWAMYGYDAGHTNYFPTEKLPNMPAIAGDLLPEKKAFNYPNPAGSETVIRYFLKEDAQVGIRIYDLSGMLVEEFAGPGVGRTYNEKTWNCSRYASGVYLCRVEAKSADENQVVFFKMALVK
jgi:M6 family metalloprotease-like protein